MSTSSRYPLLEIIAFIFQVVSALTVVAALTLAVKAYIDIEDHTTPAFIYSVGVTLLMGVGIATVVWVVAGVLLILIHIEETTRQLAESLKLRDESAGALK